MSDQTSKSSQDPRAFRAALAALIDEAVTSASSYDGADDGERMAHFIGYIAGRAHLQTTPIFERLFQQGDRT